MIKNLFNKMEHKPNIWKVPHTKVTCKNDVRGVRGNTFDTLLFFGFLVFWVTFALTIWARKRQTTHQKWRKLNPKLLTKPICKDWGDLIYPQPNTLSSLSLLSKSPERSTGCVLSIFNLSPQSSWWKMATLFSLYKRYYNFLNMPRCTQLSIELL